MSTYTDIKLARIDRTAIITLNRPHRLNAVTFRMAEELINCLDQLDADQGVRAVVITGAGDRAFCAGADMEELAANLDSSAERDRSMFSAERILTMNKPTIAAVNGYAYGGGAIYAINCDLRIAADNARFRFPGVAYGLVVGASRLPGIIGEPKAKELIFTARPVDAEEALNLGLVNHVVPAESLRSTVLELAGRIAEQTSAAVQASKEVIDLATSAPDATRREAELNESLRRTPEHKATFRKAANRITG